VSGEDCYREGAAGGGSGVSSFERKRLINHRVSFIVPGKQLYLPFLAVDLRESFRTVDADTKNKLGATAQQLFLMHLYGKWDYQFSTGSLAV